MLVYIIEMYLLTVNVSMRLWAVEVVLRRCAIVYGPTLISFWCVCMAGVIPWRPDLCVCVCVCVCVCTVCVYRCMCINNNVYVYIEMSVSSDSAVFSFLFF